MAPATSEIILFGIRAGVRLHEAVRQSYIDRTRERDFVLPLPGLPDEVTVGIAVQFFRQEGKPLLAEDVRLAALQRDASRSPTQFERDAARAKEYLELYRFHVSRASGKRADGLDAEGVLALTRVRQWRQGETPSPTAVQRIAGTLIEIGVDYFATGPGKIVGDSREKALLRELLDVLDDQSFSTDGLEGLIENLFVAALEELAEDPSLVSGDETTRMLVGAIAKGLTADVSQRLENLTEGERLFQRGRLSETASLIFRSTLRHAGETVLAHPGDFLGVDGEAEEVLVSRVGTSLLDAILPSADSPLDLGELFTAETLDDVVKSALGVLAQHPELLDLDGDGKTGLRKIVEEIAEALAEESRALGPDLFPDIARLLLDRTAANLHLLWEPDGGDEHLLVTATHTLLTQLAEPREGSEWGRALGRDTLLAVVEAVIDEVAENPGLITSRFRGKPVLDAVVTSILAELTKLELDDVPPGTVASLLETAVRAAASRADFLDRYKDASGRLKPVAAHVLEAILTSAFSKYPAHERATWTLAQATVLDEMASVAFEKLASSGVDKGHLKVLRGVLDDVVARINAKQPFTIELFSELLEQRLAALLPAPEPQPVP